MRYNETMEKNDDFRIQRQVGAGKREDAIFRNKSGQKIKYKINRRPSQMKKLSKSGKYAAKKAERAKSSVRAKGEHVFGAFRSSCASEKRDTEGLKNNKPNSIACLHWQIGSRLPAPVRRLGSGALSGKDKGLSTDYCLKTTEILNLAPYAVSPFAP